MADPLVPSGRGNDAAPVAVGSFAFPRREGVGDGFPELGSGAFPAGGEGSPDQGLAGWGEAEEVALSDGDGGVAPAVTVDSLVAVVVGVVEWLRARVSSSRRRSAGSVTPRSLARRRIPVAALGVKKYRLGTSPSSKTSDKEHASAPLWYAVVLGIQFSVADTVPERGQRPEDDPKIHSLIAGPQSRDVLSNNPTWSLAGNDAKGFPEQAASSSRKPGAPSGHADVLAGEPEGDAVHVGNLAWVCARDVADVGDAGESPLEDAAGPRVDLADPLDAGADEREAKPEPFDPAEERPDPETLTTQTDPPAWGWFLSR